MFGVTVILILGILTLWFAWRKTKFTLFKKLNIPGPEPNILFGNYWEILQKGQTNCIRRWIKQYGRVFGYYYGIRPVLIVADPDILKTVQLKEFHKFTNRPPLFEVGSNSRDFNQFSITTASGQRWKDLRSILTPTFTTSKLKSMGQIMKVCVDELDEAIEKKARKGNIFDIYNLYQNLTMDVISRTALGIHSQSQTGKYSPFVSVAKIIFALELGYITMLTFSFTELMPFFSLLRRLTLVLQNKGKHPRGELLDKTKSAIDERRRNPSSHRRDLLQLMMDAQKTQETVNDSSLAAGENDDQVPNETAKLVGGRKLTDEEVLQNASVFLLAGYETTSTALAFITHLLSHHQDVQDQVRDEIMQNLENEKELTYEVIQKCQYLDQVINESLRLYPPITFFVMRQAAEDMVVNGIKIPKGVAIQVPVYSLHHDSTFWENPEEFKPERFSKEEKARRNPLVFQPFGAGPRNCIGMRFALWEAKLALLKLLTKYRIHPKEGTKKEDLDISFTVLTMRPKKGILVNVEKL